MDEAVTRPDREPRLSELDPNERRILALKGARLGIWAWDAIEDESFWDERSYEIFGLPPRCGVGASMEELVRLIHPADRDGFQKRFQVAVSQRLPEITNEYRVVWPDGSVHQIATLGLAFYDRAGRITRAIGVAQDITRQRKKEELFQQALNLESIGRLAGGIAHDFNNLLTVINGYCELLFGELDEKTPRRAKVEQIRRAGEKAAALTRQLLAFGRKQLMAIEPLNLNTLIQELTPVLRQTMAPNMELTLILEPSLGLILADPEQIGQAITNLAANARDAMPGGGSFTLRTSNVDCSGCAVHVGSDFPRSEYVLLTLSDTGQGMDAETQKHIFEPFFTTKAAGNGAGLGLAMVYGIVAQIGGRIKCYSETGMGTVFRIYFPRLPAGQAAGVSIPEVRVPWDGTGTILVAEDQSEVRELVCASLRSSGYHVLEATTGAEALRIVEDYPESIQLLLSDVVMPEAGGAELAKVASRVRPGIRILLMSGYTDQVISHHGMLKAGVELLQKPFELQSLQAKVKELLSPPSAKPVILVVDDEAGVRGLVRDVLQTAGYQVLEAAQGKQAVAIRERQKVDVLITDLAMPDMDGIELIRAFVHTGRAPAVIATSGAFDENMLKAARLLGASATFTKPIDLDRLIAVVKSLANQ